MFILAAVMTIASGNSANAQATQRFGVAFYNLENLFDTIPNNPLGRDDEYTPAGKNQWGSKKYWNKINNLAYAISKMTDDKTGLGPAIIGVSEIENKSVLEDLVKAEPIRKWMLQICHHDSPDRRGVDVGLLYNPRFFRVLNVTNHTLVTPAMNRSRLATKCA